MLPPISFIYVYMCMLGIGRKLFLTPDGRGHPMFEGKRSVFEAYMSHEDEVTHLPSGAVLLASNGWSMIQAAAIRHEQGEVHV